MKGKLWQSAPPEMHSESVICNEQHWEDLMQDLGLWFNCQVLWKLWFFALTLVSFHGEILNRKAMIEKFWRDFTNQKVISLVRRCVMILLKEAGWRCARKNQKLEQTLEIGVVNTNNSNMKALSWVQNRKKILCGTDKSAALSSVILLEILVVLFPLDPLATEWPHF